MPSLTVNWLQRWQQVRDLVIPDPFPPDTPNYARICQLLNALDFHYGRAERTPPHTKHVEAFDRTFTVLQTLCNSPVSLTPSPETPASPCTPRPSRSPH